MQAWRRANLEGSGGKERLGREPPIRWPSHLAPPRPPLRLLRAPFRLAPLLALISAPGSLLTQAKRSLPFPLSSFLLAKQKRSQRVLTPDLPAQGGPLWKMSRPCVAAARFAPPGRRFSGARATGAVQAHTGDTGLRAPAPAHAHARVGELSPAHSHVLHRLCSALGIRGQGSVPLSPQQLLVPTPLRTAHM